ncbi:carbon-nitrogen hydrolase family protein [Amphritea sp. 2_MG-2023]|uniref:carbon-nitrogen hydrolase family protein n=1 Tax=Amphritea TaxID=515417 RepID=UPI001C06C0C6|nr:MULTISPECIES: carbon-nitrogen hydrolase family protein [Amphritea]MBU2967322.1 carbon-nitrogen hydrolase family protein [Amphritea atlantica]MDO6420470.1 carbon-nitrogen hydrolase family protein [Amphritea sp. 2_MG-2023]
MKIGAAQLRPIWLDSAATTDKIISTIAKAASMGIELLAFPESFLSGYPFWLCRTNAAAFNDPRHGRAYAQFLEAAIEPNGTEITRISEACKDYGVSIFLGVNERGTTSARGSIYCSMIVIDSEKGVCGIHRKLVPTHDERLCWAPGDAHGLQIHKIRGFRVGGLNCWENWMPLARFALYAEGEEIHIASWPGNKSVVGVAPEFIATEARVWVISVLGLLSLNDIPDSFEFKADLVANNDHDYFLGGSKIVDPTGKTIVEAEIGQEAIIHTNADIESVNAERQMKDVSGHYNRSDLLQLEINSIRPTAVQRINVSGKKR